MPTLVSSITGIIASVQEITYRYKSCMFKLLSLHFVFHGPFRKGMHLLTAFIAGNCSHHFYPRKSGITDVDFPLHYSEGESDRERILFLVFFGLTVEKVKSLVVSNINLYHTPLCLVTLHHILITTSLTFMGCNNAGHWEQRRLFIMFFLDSCLGF